MTLAQNISFQNNKNFKSHFFTQGLQLGTYILKRLWWHLKSYTTVLGIMLLTVASLGFLYIHDSGKN
ncbi:MULTISPECIES: hypothetical protein [unclassified Nodularia (in: cyanobacteria)]|uniref:hypothetical protein n=1 Tax=unclassified Nodularia (in: cyanobacteria) TaxID=2656917 RepID=UPI001D1053BA|nr:hypothetical protein [Nodularia sp. LEGE 04288]